MQSPVGEFVLHICYTITITKPAVFSKKFLTCAEILPDSKQIYPVPITIVRLIILISNRLLKNTHLLRCAHPSSLRRTVTYASFLRISRALHPDVFDQPGEKLLFQQPANCFLFSCFYMLYNFTGKAYHGIAEIIK